MKSILLIILAVGLSACSPSVSVRDARERAEPMMERASARKSAGEVEAAIRLYQDALYFNPRLALAHLDLGLLYHDHQHDPVSAIYHYRRYLDLRPETEKAGMIRDRIRLAEQLYGGQLFKLDAVDQQELDVLKQENENLQRRQRSLTDEVSQLTLNLAQAEAQIGELQVELARGRREILEAREAVREAAAREAEALERARAVPRQPVRESAAGQDAGEPRTYVVRQGDHMEGIAGRYLGDRNRWREIQELNPAVDPKRMREGEILRIPAR